MVRKKNKRKFNYIKFIVFFLSLYIVSYSIYMFFSYPIKNIFISGNTYINDSKIIEMANLEDYPSFILTSKNQIRKSLLENQYIKEVNVEKELFGKIYINIILQRAIFYDLNLSKTVFDDGSNSNEFFSVPILTNSMDSATYSKLIEAMNLIDDNIMLKISEIEYSKTEQDNERFLLTMTDGNNVYATLYKFDKINYYNDILSTLEGKKGTLYLDSGNYFTYE